MDFANEPAPDTVALAYGSAAIDLPFSSSQSLASGLVSLLIHEWEEHDKRYRESRRPNTGAPGTSKLPTKRALGYRVLKDRSYALIPPGHQMIVETHGDQQGIDKRAGFAVVHWSVIAELRRLEVQMTYGKPGWRLPLRWQLFVIADHALQRMFYRLKSLSDQVILNELAVATSSICAWYPFLVAHLTEEMSIGVPTPRGMLILKRLPTSTRFSPCEYLATTWVSDALVGTRKLQAAALHVARTQNGLVVQIGENYWPLSLVCNLSRFKTHSAPFTNVFYAEMLRHLPLATTVSDIVYGRVSSDERRKRR